MALVAGPALGLAFSVLYNEVKSITIKNTEFKPTLEKIKGTVEALKPLLDDIAKSNDELDLAKSELSGFETAMEKGAILFRKCSKVRGYSIFRKSHYKDKLDEFDETLKRLTDILQVQGVRDLKEFIILQRKLFDGIIKKGGIGASNLNTSTASCHVPQLPQHLIAGLDGPLDELKKRLLDTDKSLLLVTAMGGCGKTLLAQKFCHDPQVKERFKDYIFFVTFSKTPPALSDIVLQLYKHAKKEPLVNEVDAVEQLKFLLNQIGETAPILLVLDDVWDGSESLVKTLVLQRPEYKILVTSRSELKGFGPPEYDHPYHLIPLNDEDAMTLFRHWASLDAGNTRIPDETVKKMVDYYKVFPLGLKIVAGSLKGKPLEYWNYKLEECSNASSELSTESDLVKCLQSLLKDLDAKVKECFMDFGSFPEDHRIPAAALIDMWAELYGLRRDGEPVVKIFDLIHRNLVNLIVTRKDVKEDDGYYNEHFVTQHDLLRDLTIHLSNNNPPGQRKRLFINLRGNNELPNWWDEFKETPFSAHLLAISSEEELSSELSEMKLPEAKALVLNFWSEDYALLEFVKHMKKLMVLIVTSYKSFPAELKNFEYLGHLENLRRIRLERISIPSLTLVSFKKLEKISFFMCSIGRALSNCSTKISKLFPRLREMNVDFCNDLVELPAELCDVNHLQKLTLSHCPKLRALPEEIGKLVNLKELRLRCCISLVVLPDSICKLSELTFLDISDCISIESLPDDIGDLCNLSKLNMTHCSRLPKLPWSVSYLTRLKDLICDEEKQELWEPFLLPYLPNTVMRSTEEDINLNWLPQYKIA